MSAIFRRRSQREIVKLNVEDTTPTAAENAAEATSVESAPVEGAEAEKKPVRRRVSRRATAAAGAPTETPAADEAASTPAPAEAPAEAAAEAPVEAPAEAPKKRVTRTRKKPAESAAPTESTAGADAEAAVAAPTSDAAAATEEPAAPKKRVTRTRKKAADSAPATTAEATTAEAAASEPAAAATTEPAGGDTAASDAVASDAAATPEKEPATRGRRRVQRSTATAEKAEAAETAEAETTAEDAPAEPAARRTGRASASSAAGRQAGERTSRPAASAASDSKSDDSKSEAPKSEAPKTQAPKTESTADGAESGGTAAGDGGATDAVKSDAVKSDAASNAEGERNGRRRGRGRGQRSDSSETSEAQESTETPAEEGGADRSDRGSARSNGESPRSSRTRQRDRKRRGQGDDLEPEITEDDVLLPIAGILDVLDNYAFVRTSGYLPGMSDVYVSLGQVKKYGMRRGDAVVGAIRQPREGDGGGRQKYNAIVKVDTINGRPVEENEKRADIADLTPIYPQERLRLGQGTSSIGRSIDRVAPLGLGHRAVFAVPAKLSTIDIVSEIADSVSAANPDAHLMVAVTNARPEDETRLQRTVRGEVIAASFDRPAEDQTTIIELAVDRARRLVELGHDVVLLLDSLTDLAGAYVQHQQSGRTTTEVAEALAITQVKRLLAAARNVENGGSLTLIATVAVKSGVALDKELLREIMPVLTGFVRFSGSRFAPEVELDESYSVGIDALLDAKERAEISKLRSA